MESSGEQLRGDFELFGVTVEGEEVVARCLQLCEEYKVATDDLAATWVSFSSLTGTSELTLESLDHLQRVSLSKQKKSGSTAKKNVARQTLDLELSSSLPLNTGQDDDILASYGGTPNYKGDHSPDGKKQGSRKQPVHCARAISAQFSPASLSPRVSTPSQKFSTRTNAGDVVAAHGEPDGSWLADFTFKPKVEIQPMGGQQPLTRSYTFMFERLKDTAEALEDTITYLGDQLLSKLQLSEFSPLSAPSTEDVWVVGRVCCDSVGRLNAASVLLEGDFETSNAATVHLDLSHLSEYSIFPGQVVAVRGLITTAKRMVVQEIVPGCLLPPPPPPPTDSAAVQVVVACGPFTTSDNLLFEPLSDLLASLQEKPPHLLVLLGPFLDAAHPLVADGLVQEDQEKVFHRCLATLTAAMVGIGTQVVVVSSSKEVCGVPVYPTPPYVSDVPLTCYSDPALLQVEGFTMAVTSTDILFHLGKEEISHPPQGSDRLARLSEHLLLQQNMYPLYPAAEDLCVEHGQTLSHTRLPSTPNILLLPSDLRYFVKEVDGCLVINPQRLAKGQVGGTYTRLQLSPHSCQAAIIRV